MRRALSTYGPPTAPMMPVMIVSVAVTAGAPPIRRDISIDTAAVADLGARDKTVDADACASIATARPTKMLASEPATSASAMDAYRPWRRLAFRYSGSASATTAVPNKYCSTATLSKYALYGTPQQARITTSAAIVRRVGLAIGALPSRRWSV